MTVLVASRLPLPLWRRGKVREVYQVDHDRLLELKRTGFMADDPLPDRFLRMVPTLSPTPLTPVPPDVVRLIEDFGAKVPE